MPDFQGIPGVAVSALSGPFVRSPAMAIRALRGGVRVCTSAGDDGSITAWIDDAGAYRAELHRYCATRAAGKFTTKAKLREWLDLYWPAIHHAEAMPSPEPQP